MNKPNTLHRIWVPIITLLGFIFITLIWYFGRKPVSWYLIFILILIALAWFADYVFRQIINKPQIIKNSNPLRKIFFQGVRYISLLLLLTGITGAILVFLNNPDNIYQAIGIIITTIWATIFLFYFIWALYHYNINYGLTDKDWDKIFEAREKRRSGQWVDFNDLNAPDKNPYERETFGLPAGTVRGMIAFTLLFGSISMMIISIGLDNEIDQNSFYWDHFEFFKTAFLMMIAFYFGNRSLKYLQTRWPSAQQARGRKKEYDEEPHEDGELPQGEPEEPLEEEVETGRISPTFLKKILQTKESEQFQKGEGKESGELKLAKLEFEYPHLQDNEVSKFLTDEMIKSVAEKNDVNAAVLFAVIDVESSGTGFLRDGRPKILFEGHVFWRNLERLNLKPEDYLKIDGIGRILYKKWTKEFYLGGAGEYDRLEKAALINPEAAYCAASWGKFQILGENIPAGNLPNRKDIYEFVEAQKESELEHLKDFIDFIKTKKLGGHALISYIQRKNAEDIDWGKFAEGYNGKYYAQNNYVEKLKKAYEKNKHIYIS